MSVDPAAGFPTLTNLDVQARPVGALPDTSGAFQILWDRPKNKSQYDGLDKVPKGKTPVVSANLVNGKYKVIGYVDGDANKIADAPNGLSGAPFILFADAPAAAVDAISQTYNLGTKVVDGSTKMVSLSGTTPGGQPNNPAVSTSTTPTGTTGAGAGGYDPTKVGGTAAFGDLNSIYSNMDDNKLKVWTGSGAQASSTIAGSIAAMGGSSGSFTAQGEQKTIHDMINEFLQETPAEQQNLAKQLQAADYLSSADKSPYAIAKAYEQALRDLSLENAAGGANSAVTVSQFLSQQAQASASQPASKTHQIHSSQIDLTDPSAAHALVRNAMASALGRNPTAQEIAQFTASIQAYEKANPKVENGTTTTDQGDYTQTESNKTVSGGLQDPSTYAQQWVEQNFPGQAHATSIGANLFGLIHDAVSQSHSG